MGKAGSVVYWLFAVCCLLFAVLIALVISYFNEN